ncbi:MAG: DNA mismatch repair endonuclease MutL [Bacteroidetes bacterium]|nr:MAG: DNA mismatch repair endonuclease MutL [Bacteroidota bacterium]
MQNVIQLLPEAIANQIAAGEVVQRPASVVKELMENSVDAGAQRVDVLVKQAGKALIQVTDNGGGMTAQDARMAFERHATSKIRSADDLFKLHTFGFRGEALASIAAVAQVRLRTRLHSEELGTEIEIEGSEVKKQGPAALPPGTTFQVRNLFFNVPARRKFLKSDPSETRHILTEFIRVALSHPNIHFTLFNDENQVHDLRPGTLKDRIIALFGREMESSLTEIEESTGYVRISGLIGAPNIYRKQRGEQFFFINDRYIKSNILGHAIATVYQEYIPKESFPFYCIFLDIDPERVDVNIHPTKTEVKFDDEQTLYVLLQGAVKQALGDMHHAPDTNIESDLYKSIYSSEPEPRREDEETVGSFRQAPREERASFQDWNTLYSGSGGSGLNAPPRRDRDPVSKDLFGQSPLSRKTMIGADAFLIQFQESYILTQKDDYILIIDQNLAHQRILYEKFLNTRRGSPWSAQQLLFPQTLEFSAADYTAIREVEEMLGQMGFEVKEFGKNTLIVYGTPSGIATAKIRDIFDQILADVKLTGVVGVRNRMFENIARSVAMRSAVQPRQKLSVAEMRSMAEELFRCEVPGFSPSGRPTYKELSPLELEEYFR